MIPAPFDYQLVRSVEEALAAVAAAGEDAKWLAGGQSLLPMMKLRLATPQVLIDISRLDALSYLRIEGEEVAIGALTKHHELATSALLHQQCPLLAQVAALVGDPQIRHLGTLGGSLAHADPAGDLPTAVLALGATLVLRSRDGERRVAATDFFTGYFQTALGPQEMLVEVRVPRGGALGWAYEKFVQRANDWAIVSVAVAAGKDAGAGGTAAGPPYRVALGNMGATPLRASGTETALTDGASVAAAAALASRDTAPVADLHADAGYRRHLATVLTERALRRAAGADRG